MIQLMQGDCLDVMKEIPDGSVDMVLADPPYGTTACKWDTVIDLPLMWEQLKRVIKPNGAIVMTASQPFTSVLLLSNVNMFGHQWVWEKEQGVNFLTSKKNPMKVHEDVLVFYRDLGRIRGSATEYSEIRQYMQTEKARAGLTPKQLKALLGNDMAGHYFTNGVQFCIPSEDNFDKLKKAGLFGISYQELKEWYDRLGERVKAVTYKPQMTEGNPYVSGLGDSGEVTGSVVKKSTVNSGTRFPRSIQFFKRETGKHPTQKPVALMEYLIRTYTHEGETVLDFTMGSGTTGVAAKNLGRKFIGIELEKEYFKIAARRIHEA